MVGDISHQQAQQEAPEVFDKKKVAAIVLQHLAPEHNFDKVKLAIFFIGMLASAWNGLIGAGVALIGLVVSAFSYKRREQYMQYLINKYQL